MNNKEDTGLSGVEFEFLKGHIAATLALIQGLAAQRAIDPGVLDNFFLEFLEKLPNTRQTLSLRLVIDQWRQGIRDVIDESEPRRSFLAEVRNNNAED